MCINISICLHSLFCCRSSMANFPCGASSRFSPRTRHALGSSIIGGNQLPHPKRRRMLRFIFIKNRALQRLPLLRMWVWVCVCVCLPFTSDAVAVPLNCYCSRCHIIRQYGNVWATVRYVDRAVPSAPLTMHVACIILITVVTATHCGIIFDELLLRHADINI